MSGYVRAWDSDVLHARGDCAYLARTRDSELMEIPPGLHPPMGLGEWRLCSRCSTGGRVGKGKPAPALSPGLELESAS